MSLSRRYVAAYSAPWPSSRKTLRRSGARSTGCLLHGLPAIHRHRLVTFCPVLGFLSDLGDFPIESRGSIRHGDDLRLREERQWNTRATGSLEVISDRMELAALLSFFFLTSCAGTTRPRARRQSFVRKFPYFLSTFLSTFK